MPNSVRTIVKKCLYKGAITQEEYNKIIRKLDSSEQKGHWEYLYDGSRTCSNCGSWWEFENDPDKKGVNYCPNCGARTVSE